MRSEIGLEMAAPPKVVFDLASDVSAWSRRLPHYRRAAVNGRFAGRALADFVAMRPLVGRLSFPVAWRAMCWSDDSDPDDLRLHFTHVRGVTSGMRVTWHIRPSDQPTESEPADAAPTSSIVTIEHDFERPLPLIGTDLVPRLVDRLFTRAIAARTLARFRELAERGSRWSSGASGSRGEPFTSPPSNSLS